ncbi:MAG: type II toxin-antitoxin system VapC family toxin [Gammaproteobacteria bacterium]|nr:type II toxin-antitoxin system VapC family toxin [Gammaproteobacteria bacterium]MYK45509.1 type II toxin-antitoxin system VapC family toxin [Gammaproteobacteria bacterium]
MILPDINLLVYAYNEDAPLHSAAKAWWEGCLSDTKTVGLAWVVALGFVRIMSNRRVLARPMPATEAIGHCRSWMMEPNAQIVLPGPTHLDILTDLVAGPIGPNLVTDAHLAALAIEHQAELHSNDSDFARFPGLAWRNPLTSTSTG